MAPNGLASGRSLFQPREGELERPRLPLKGQSTSILRRLPRRLAHAFKKPIASGLRRYYPSAVRELLRQRGLSLWYPTSHSERPQRVWGYVDVHSIEPGEGFNLMLSTGPGFGSVVGHVEVSRIGFHEGADRRKVYESDVLDVESLGMNATAAAVGPAWPRALEIADTASWVSGYYSVDFVFQDGSRDGDIAFLVVTQRARSADVLVKLATTTYQAYNRWGGHNLYEWESPSTMDGGHLGVFEGEIALNRGDMVSFDRPTRSEFWEWEYDFVLWLEEIAQEQGVTVAYASGFDLAESPSLVSDCKLLISVGHDEYWSKEEFDHVYDRIFREGGHTLFLGSNCAYWQVRYVDINAPSDTGSGQRGRQLVCFKSTDDPISHRASADPELLATARFRENARRPETMLMGVAYQSNLPFRNHVDPSYDFRVETTDLPFFDGTGLRHGDVIEGILGHEWDNRDPEATMSCPGEPRVEGAERLWDARRSRIPEIPPELLTVVFSGAVKDIRGLAGLAEAVYFESPAGARVFSAATNRWSWALHRAGFIHPGVARFTRNLILSCRD